MDAKSAEGGIRVLVVDDQDIYHAIVKRILAGHEDIVVVAGAGTAHEALDMARRHRPDVVLMDQSLPDGQGTDAARRINATVKATRVVMVTASADDHTLAAARKAGCTGYVLKDRLVHDLPAAVRAAHRGETTLPAQGMALFTSALFADDDEPL